MVQDQLAGKEMTIGRYYLRSGDPMARHRPLQDRGRQVPDHLPHARGALSPGRGLPDRRPGRGGQAQRRGARLQLSGRYLVPGGLPAADQPRLPPGRRAEPGRRQRGPHFPSFGRHDKSTHAAAARRRGPGAGDDRVRHQRRRADRDAPDASQPPTAATQAAPASAARQEAAPASCTASWGCSQASSPAAFRPARFSAIFGAMLIGLGDPRCRPDRAARPGVRAGPDRAHRRDRRRQVDHPGRAGPGDRRARRRRPRAPRRGPGLRPPPSSRRRRTIAAWVDPRGEGPGLRAGRGSGAAPHALAPTAARAPSSTTSRPASPCCASWAPCWSRCTASTRRSACSTPRTHRPLLDAFGGLAAEVGRLRRGLERAGARRASRRRRCRTPPAARPRKPRSSPRASPSSTGLDPREGEEAELAERTRPAGRRREDAGRHRAGRARASAAARSASGSASRCGRWSGRGSARSPAGVGAEGRALRLIGAAIEAVDRALSRARRGRRRRRRRRRGVRLRARPAGEGRGAAVRPARRGPQARRRRSTPCRPRRAEHRRAPAGHRDTARRRWPRPSRPPPRPAPPISPPPRRSAAARRAAGDRLAAAVEAELAPLKLDKARFRVAVEPLAEERAGPAGADRVQFEIATNPGAPFGRAGRDRLGRRACPLRAGAEGRARRPRRRRSR